MENALTKRLMLSGLFIAIVLPLAFHAVEGVGNIFLPMHISVLILGFFLDWPFVLVIGILIPFLSSLITGMPPFFPVMVFMISELATYGVMVSLLYRKYEKSIYISLIISMICGRIVVGIVVWILTTFFMVQLPKLIIFIKGAIIKGFPV